MKEPRRIAVCGLGKLGACIAGVFAETFEVIGVDTNEATVGKVVRGEAPVEGEPGLAELYDSGKVQATTSHAIAVQNSDICFFIVPTPSLLDGRFDNQYLIRAISSVAEQVAKQHKKDYIFVINSTVVPRSCEDVFVPLIESYLHDLPYGLVYKPEFIALGSVIKNLREPNYILIGCNDKEVARRVAHLYSHVTETGNTHKMSLRSAELTKIATNCFLTMKISFANQVGMIADELGADAKAVLSAVGDDERIGPRCLIPGLPYGGPCLPRDNRMMQAITHFAPLCEATDNINNELRNRTLRQIVGLIHDTHAPVGILGMAYKVGTPVTEESFGVWLADRLRAGGIEVRTFDPIAPHSHALAEVQHCKVVVVACDHPIFQNLQFLEETTVIDPSHYIKPAKKLVATV